MNVSEYGPQQGQAIPLIYRLQRMFFAACIVLGIAATLALVATSPQYYSPQNGTAVMVSTFATANAALLQAHFIAGVLTVYLLPLSFMAMTWLAMRRAPWHASIVILVIFITTFPFAAFSAQDALTNDLAHMGSNPLFTTIAQQFNDDGVMSYYNALFVIGTILGPVLVGITLWRTRVIPIWAAILITLSRLLVFTYPFTAHLPGIYVQIPSWIPLLIGCIPASLTMLRGSNEEHQSAASKSL